MMRILLILLVSCVWSLVLSAQETYMMTDNWESDGRYFAMYKVDFFEGNPELMFQIAKTRFHELEGEPGVNFWIWSFEFNEDRTQVYFIETEGDLYRYTIATDKLELLADLIPNTLDNWFYTGVAFPHFINDSILYLGSIDMFDYNINTDQYVKRRGFSFIAEGQTPLERDISHWKMVRHKSDLIYRSFSQKLMKFDHTDFYQSTEIIEMLELDALADLVSYQSSCDSIEFYSSIGTDEFSFYKVDLSTGDLTYSHPKPLFADPPSNLYSYRNYYTQSWQECELRLDLDFDDSTADGSDFLLDNICRLTGVSICDDDVRLGVRESVYDSIKISITNPVSQQMISCLMGNYEIKNNNTNSVTIVTNGSSTNIELEQAMRDALYIYNGSEMIAEVKIQVVGYLREEQSTPAISTLRFVEDYPYAGEDINLEFCEEEESINLESEIDEMADTDGRFYDEGFAMIDAMLDISIPQESSIYYIVSKSGCQDTANINVIVNENPEVQEIEDLYACFGEIVNIDLSTVGLPILWDDNSTEAIRSIMDSGMYTYIITNDAGCQASETFSVFIDKEPDMKPVEAMMCKDDEFEYLDKIYEEAGLYADTLLSVNGCDSIIYNISLSYFSQGDILDNGILEFCDDEYLILDVDMVTDLTIEGVSVEVPYEFDAIGSYLLAGYDFNGCYVEQLIEIVSYPVPEIITEDIEDVSYISNIALPVSYEGTIVSYKWSPSEGLDCQDCPYPIITSKYEGMYTIEVVSDKGCMATNNISIAYIQLEYFVANIIAREPTDIRNGSLYLMANTDLRYSMQVYDRWGNRMFDREGIYANNPTDGWNPNAELDSGVYVYYMSIETEDGIKILVSDVTVL